MDMDIRFRARAGSGGIFSPSGGIRIRISSRDAGSTIFDGLARSGCAAVQSPALIFWSASSSVRRIVGGFIA